MAKMMDFEEYKRALDGRASVYTKVTKLPNPRAPTGSHYRAAIRTASQCRTGLTTTWWHAPEDVDAQGSCQPTTRDQAGSVLVFPCHFPEHMG